MVEVSELNKIMMYSVPHAVISGGDHIFLQASTVELMMIMINLLIMRKIKEKVFVKKKNDIIIKESVGVVSLVSVSLCNWYVCQI